ncbi:MAG: hypothetical protein ABSC62_02645 [Terracidiphilus sp.]|jgi:hypothetical protein
MSPAIFQCPNCNETIFSSAESCSFCGAKVDHEAASRDAERLAKINQACSGASSMRSAALMLPVLFVLRFVPFIRLVGGIGFLLLLLGIPLWAMRWWHKYGGIVSGDPDVVRARRTVKTIAIIVPMVLAFFLVVEILMAFVALR